MGWTIRLRVAVITHKYQLVARFVRTIDEPAGFSAAVNAVTNIFGFARELVIHTTVKNVERPFPVAIILVLFAVLYNAAVNLIHLFKSTVLH